MDQEARFSQAIAMLISDVFNLTYWRFMSYSTDLANVDFEETTRLHRTSMRVAEKEVEKYKFLFSEDSWDGALKMFGAERERAYLDMKEVVEKVQRGEI